MNAAGNNQAEVGGGSDDDSGKDSDEEEISKAKEKFEDFFKRTKKYWISYAREKNKLAKSDEDETSVEEYALVLAEEEFMKETIPNLDQGASSGRAHNGYANNVMPRNRNAVHPPSQPQPQRLPTAPLQQRVQLLQQQLQRVDLDEGIE